MKQTMIALDQQVKSDAGRIANLSKTVASNQALLLHLATLKGNDQAGWALAKSLYLTRLANLDLHFQSDAAQAIQLLELAYANLKSLDDPSLLPLRAQFAKAIQSVKAMPSVPVTELYLKLNALDSAVDTLPLTVTAPTAPNKEDNLLASDSKDKVPTVSNWHRALQKSLQVISQALVIRKRTYPISPLLTDTEYRTLVFRLHSLFAQVKWALLNKNETVFKAGLTDIKQLIEQYFDSTHPSVSSMNQSVSELLAVNLAPSVPDLAPLIKAVQQEAMQKAQTAMKKDLITSKQEVQIAKPKQTADVQSQSVLPPQLKGTQVNQAKVAI